MNFRVVAGICLFVSILVILPVPALPDIRELSAVSHSTISPTGQTTVTLTNIDGTQSPEAVTVMYTMGGLNEIPAYAVSGDQNAGYVMVTLMDPPPAQDFLLPQGPGVKVAIPTAGSKYFINTISIGSTAEPLLANDKTFGVVPPTANYYADKVPEGKQHEWIDLDWKDPKQDLNLTVYAPDATFGPYMDTADGRKDGRIFLDVGSRLNVTPGNWFFKVENRWQDSAPYRLNTYSA